MHIILETVYISLSGTIANFNFDTSATAVSTSMAHLSSQYYDICIRRARNYCSICYSPVISGTTTASSFGLGANAVATIATANVGTYMSGVTTQGASLPAMVGEGDYLEILAMQVPPTTSTTITGEAVDYYNNLKLFIARICSHLWSDIWPGHHSSLHLLLRYPLQSRGPL